MRRRWHKTDTTVAVTSQIIFGVRAEGSSDHITPVYAHSGEMADDVALGLTLVEHRDFLHLVIRAGEVAMKIDDEDARKKAIRVYRGLKELYEESTGESL